MPNSTAGSPPGRQRVVVVGGGPAGVSAAFWLSHPRQQGRFDVSLYTQGWRLGGKCVSGRNAQKCDRIEEHALHLPMGCYHNAFKTIRACYDEWRRPAGYKLDTWQKAFLPLRQATLMEEDGPGSPPSWAIWSFPQFPELPGDPGDEFGEAEVTAMERIRSLAGRLSHRLVTYVDVPDFLANAFDESLLIARGAIESGSPNDHQQAAEKLTAVNGLLKAQVGRPAARPPADGKGQGFSSDAHRALILANLGLAILLGCFCDILLGGEGAFERLDQLDFRQWLKRHYASDEALASAPIRALYGTTFAFPGGRSDDINKGSIAAGVTLKFMLETLVGYRNAPVWLMAAGMSEVLFTPLYDVLQQRNVPVHFFHRITDLSLGGAAIDQIQLSQQARTADGSAYRPYLSLRGLECWPNQPCWDQLADGDKLKQCGVNFESSACTVSVGQKTLKRGNDFDIVILALPPEVLKGVAASLAVASGAWQTALDASRSIATQSVQLWMKPNLADLGWTLGPTALAGYADPLIAYVDMSQRLPVESWSGPDAPQSTGYFCGCMTFPDNGPVTAPIMQQRADAIADTWIAANIPALWPNAGAPPGPDYVAHYVRANFDISDQYVQTPPGNVATRLSSAGVAGFTNLYVVGDWTKTRWSGGCLESAVESAMLASRAISGIPGQVYTDVEEQTPDP
jgi:uncharacterized protein with NAD-binding domain and iron-sulfur cluster